MKRKWKKPVVINDGVHSGNICLIEYKTQPYAYVRISIKLEKEGTEDSPIILIYSCPDNLSPGSKFGKLIQSFGVEFAPEGEIDVEEILMNKEVVFQTQMKQSSKSEQKFAEIIDETLKPAGTG